MGSVQLYRTLFRFDLGEYFTFKSSSNVVRESMIKNRCLGDWDP